jgi:hypothetical protein
MPSAPSIAIPDFMVSKWSPVTGKLMTRLRNNVHAARQLAVRNVFNKIGGLTTSTSFVVVGTFWIMVPDSWFGANGIRLEILLHGLAAGTPPPTPRGEGRYTVSWTAAGGGSQVSPSFFFQTIEAQPLAVVFAPPANAKLQIDVEVRSTTGSGHTAELAWERSVAASAYLLLTAEE